jgi:hypothetical protein
LLNTCAANVKSIADIVNKYAPESLPTMQKVVPGHKKDQKEQKEQQPTNQEELDDMEDSFQCAEHEIEVQDPMSMF